MNADGELLCAPLMGWGEAAVRQWAYCFPLDSSGRLISPPCFLNW